MIRGLLFGVLAASSIGIVGEAAMAILVNASVHADDYGRFAFVIIVLASACVGLSVLYVYEPRVLTNPLFMFLAVPAIATYVVSAITMARMLRLIVT